MRAILIPILQDCVGFKGPGSKLRTGVQSGGLALGSPAPPWDNTQPHCSVLAHAAPSMWNTLLFPFCFLGPDSILPPPIILPPTGNPPCLNSGLTCSHTLKHAGVLCPRHLLGTGPHEDMRDKVINEKGPCPRTEIKGETNK